MATFVETTKMDFSLSPQERKQRQEIMEAMQTVQSALNLLSTQQSEVSTDLKAHKILAVSQQCMAKLQSFVEQTFTPPS